MPLSTNHNSSENRINYSTSFVISNNCLDTCPKCGQNVCEHTSVADVINLPNSVSQDFSTYSSDSSLIKQLFNDSTSNIANNRISLTAINQNYYLQNQHLFKLNQKQQQQFLNLTNTTTNNNRNQIDLKNNSNNFFTFNNPIKLNDTNQNITINNFMPSYTLRPHSCQVMIIDNETSDKLIRDFFDPSSNRIRTMNQEDAEETAELENNLNTNDSNQNANNTQIIVPVKKKSKFSHFRLFHLKHKESRGSSPRDQSSNKQHRSGGAFVNCLTSSTSSSSCEEIQQYKLKSSANKKLDKNSKKDTKNKNNSEETETTLLSGEDENNNNNKNVKKCKLNNNNNQKSVMSLNNSDYDKNEEAINVIDDGYNEYQIPNSKSCMILDGAVSKDIDDEEFDEDNNKNNILNYSTTSPSSSSSTLTIKSNSKEATETKNSNKLISVPLNNNSNLVFNYERKKEVQQLENNNNNNKRVTLKLLKNNCYHTVNNNKERPVSQLAPNENSITINNDNDLSKCLSISQNIIASSNNTRQNNLVAVGRRAPIEKMSNIISSSLSYNMIDNSLMLDDNKTNYDDCDEDTYFDDKNHNKTEKGLKIMKTTQNKLNINNNNNNNSNNNRKSFFSSCSSCNTNTSTSAHSTTLTKTTSTNSYNMYKSPKINGGPSYKHANLLLLDSSTNTSVFTNTFQNSNNSSIQPKYHSISIIFILIGLFSLNFMQESFLLFYYFNTEQFYWFMYSMLALFSGQIITLILSILAEIDLVKIQKTTKSNSSSEELYSIFKNPFCKLFLLVPGYLIASVYIQFFKHVFNYRKASGHTRFIFEFQLSLYLFFNALFHSLPLAIINSCYLAAKAKSFSYSSFNSISPFFYQELFSIFNSSYSYFTSQTNNSETKTSSATTAYILDDKNIERRNLLVLLLVSIFITISIGICLFTTYFELMKQMNYLTVIFKNNLFFNFNYYYYNLIDKSTNKTNETGNKNENNEDDDDDSSNKLNNISNNNLGIVEILVYFCYRFCLVCSRLAVIALFWYLFSEWLLIAFSAHVLISYFVTLLTLIRKKKNNNKNVCEKNLKLENCKEGLTKLIDSGSSSSSNSSNNHIDEITSVKKKSKLNQYSTFFIICLLSFIDLFMNQLSELYHIKKVLTYYFLYFIQNITVLTYWLMLTLFKARQEQLNMENNEENGSPINENLRPSSNTNNLLANLLKSASIVSPKSETSSTSITSSQTQTELEPTTYACYATLIYLCIILLTIFGLILKFLHLHILRKRYRNYFEK